MDGKFDCCTRKLFFLKYWWALIEFIEKIIIQYGTLDH